MSTPPKLTLRCRKRAITAILEARFSVGAFEEIRRGNAAYWASARNDMARGIYGEAMREKQRLANVPDAQIVAEAAAIGCGLAPRLLCAPVVRRSSHARRRWPCAQAPEECRWARKTDTGRA